MRVKMTTNVAGKPNYASGDVVELEDRVAKAWIEEGMCVPVRDGAPIERATK